MWSFFQQSDSPRRWRRGTATTVARRAVGVLLTAICCTTICLSIVRADNQRADTWLTQYPEPVARRASITSPFDPPASAGERRAVAVRPVYSTLPPPPGWTAEEFMHLAAKPLDLDTPVGAPADLSSRSGRLSSHKNGFFQKFEISAAWLPRTGDENLGVTETQTFLTVAVPLPTRDYPLLISPGFNAIALSGPPAPDLPPQVYGTYLELMWLPKISDRWLGIFSVTPGVYSDFDGVGNDAWRIKARALARYDWIPNRVQLMFGVLYLDRYDVNWLPAGGIIWTPNDNTRYELVFPRPKFSHCLVRAPEHEDWIYFAGEFGGDQYAISYPNGSTDSMILRDWRLYLGVERKRAGGAGERLEIGYVFSRSIQFQSTPKDYNSGDTLMLRAVFDY